MSINWQIIPVEWACVFEKVTGHPVIFGGTGDILHQLAEVAAMKLRTAFARRADEANSEALVIRHRNERSFAVARESFDADLFGVNGFIGLEIIESAARAPSPYAQ